MPATAPPPTPRRTPEVPARSWLWLCATLAVLSLGAALLPRAWIDWQPQLALTQPWRLFTAALAHLTPWHLAANLAGCAALAVLGLRARLGAEAALAGWWAWPASQLGLLLRPDLERYAGLSGELHALAAIAGVTLLQRIGRDRAIGAALCLGLIAKLVSEAPLGPALRTTVGFDFPVAPFAHLSGAVAGVGAAWLARRLTMRPLNDL